MSSDSTVTARKDADPKLETPQGKSESHKALRVLAWSILVGVVAVIAYAFQARDGAQYLSMVAVGIMIGGAALLVGGLLGFLFGVPRAMQEQRAAEVSEGAQGSEQPPASWPARRYGANTNLEDISDWLTKIIVGVGLTQLTKVPEGLQTLTRYVAPALDPAVGTEVFAGAVMLYYSLVGFLFAYLWARLFLMSALVWAEETTIKGLESRLDETRERTDSQVKQVLARVKQTEVEQAQDRELVAKDLTQTRPAEHPDWLALALKDQQLDLEQSEPPAGELNDAVARASTLVKVQTFSEARTVRNQNWETNKQQMERTIPLFRALIDCDRDHKFHRNHGQLGYALKDKASPAWDEAESELTEAIEIRERLQDSGWVFYEFNRAICRIMQDPEFARRQPTSDLSLVTSVFSDLAVAWQALDIADIIRAHGDIQEWMRLNSITERDLDASQIVR